MPRMSRVRDRLDALVATHDVAQNLAADPLGFVHRAAPDDREVVALLAATLAFGNVKAIRASIARVLTALGDSPSATIDRESETALAARLTGFAHRVYKGADVARMLANAGALRRAHGTLGAFFAARYRENGDLREALALLADALRGATPPPSSPLINRPRRLSGGTPPPAALVSLRNTHGYSSLDRLAGDDVALRDPLATIDQRAAR